MQEKYGRFRLEGKKLVTNWKENLNGNYNGHTGKAHVTAEQSRDLNQGIVGTESYVLDVGDKLRMEVVSNNEIRIHDGIIVHQGCAASIGKNKYDSLTIENGTQGQKRIDLIDGHQGHVGGIQSAGSNI